MYIHASNALYLLTNKEVTVSANDLKLVVTFRAVQAGIFYLQSGYNELLSYSKSGNSSAMASIASLHSG